MEDKKMQSERNPMCAVSKEEMFCIVCEVFDYAEWKSKIHSLG